MTTVVFKHGQATVDFVVLSKGMAALSGLWSGTPGLGHGRAVMEKAVDYADAHGMTVRLLVARYGDPHHNALTNPQLEEFYAKFGFEKQTTRRPVLMIRYPSQGIQRL